MHGLRTNSARQQSELASSTVELTLLTMLRSCAKITPQFSRRLVKPSQNGQYELCEGRKRSFYKAPVPSLSCNNCGIVFAQALSPAHLLEKPRPGQNIEPEVSSNTNRNLKRCIIPSCHSERAKRAEESRPCGLARGQRRDSSATPLWGSARNDTIEGCANAQSQSRIGIRSTAISLRSSRRAFL